MRRHFRAQSLAVRTESPGSRSHRMVIPCNYMLFIVYVNFCACAPRPGTWSEFDIFTHDNARQFRHHCRPPFTHLSASHRLHTAFTPPCAPCAQPPGYGMLSVEGMQVEAYNPIRCCPNHTPGRVRDEPDRACTLQPQVTATSTFLLDHASR